MNRTVAVAFFDQGKEIRGKDAPVGINHSHQNAGAVSQWDRLHRHICPCFVGLVKPDGFPQLFKTVQIGTLFDSFEWVVFKKHTVANSVHNFLF